MKDYLSILKIPKKNGSYTHVTKRMVQLSYNPLARENHPDRHPPERKLVQEEKMKALNEAKEFLLNDEKRAKCTNYNYYYLIKDLADAKKYNDAKDIALQDPCRFIKYSYHLTEILKKLKEGDRNTILNKIKNEFNNIINKPLLPHQLKFSKFNPSYKLRLILEDLSQEQQSIVLHNVDLYEAIKIRQDLEDLLSLRYDEKEEGITFKASHYILGKIKDKLPALLKNRKGNKILSIRSRSKVVSCIHDDWNTSKNNANAICKIILFDILLGTMRFKTEKQYTPVLCDLVWIFSESMALHYPELRKLKKYEALIQKVKTDPIIGKRTAWLFRSFLLLAFVTSLSLAIATGGQSLLLSLIKTNASSATKAALLLWGKIALGITSSLCLYETYKTKKQNKLYNNMLSLYKKHETPDVSQVELDQ
ncbi:MAG: hypothetical protein COB50_01905 [Thiotrichales bacterium]|nr:MAG: hypothetical protein COB50_01905 [Thiotrichales bacterium]